MPNTGTGNNLRYQNTSLPKFLTQKFAKYFRRWFDFAATVSKVME